MSKSLNEGERNSLAKEKKYEKWLEISPIEEKSIFHDIEVLKVIESWSFFSI